MLKKVLFWGVTIVVAVALFCMPGMVETAIPSIYYVTPGMKTYENVVSCTGAIQAVNVSEIYVDSPLVARSVAVSVGDIVSRGDLLVEVDQERTAKLSVQPGELLQSLMEEEDGDAAARAAADIDWQGLAAMYGLSAVTSTGDMDYNAILQDVLSSAGASGGASTASVVSSADTANILAPIGGIVTGVDIKSNVPVTVGKSVLTIADTSSYMVMAAVSEADIAKVQVGDSATVRGAGFSGSTYYGTVTKIYPMARKTLSGTATETVVDVEILLDGGDSALKPGFTAKVEITGGENRSLITVPYETIKQDENNNEYVYEFLDGKLQKTVVVTGQEMTNEVEILSGLRCDSVVVYNPSEVVKEGNMVHIKGRADVS